MKTLQSLRFLPFIFFFHFAQGQIPAYHDYIGAGHSEGVRVSASSTLLKPERTKSASGESSLDGGGLDSRKMEAARFLAQAGFGGTPNQIAHLASNLNFEKWIDEQFALGRTSMLAETQKAYAAAKNLRAQEHDVSNYSNRDKHFRYAWWHSIMTKPDQLRQRVATALSEIFVISVEGPISNHGDNYASYYDVLMKNAFGNYEDLLYDVSLHPAMGVYLTHFRNPKTDTTTNTFPDENYAREVLQLFSIGLFELNQDGSLKTDNSGNAIPTYDNEDIIELSKVFTGLGAGRLDQNAIENGRQLSFRTRQNDLDYTVPMAMYEEEHEQGSKHLLNDFVIPSGLPGLDDIRLAIQHLSNHPNVGPFIGRKLIQQLVKSNPSPSYIEDVASAFNDNGEGVRGDMKAVIKAILLHEEARTCLWQTEPTNGKLIPPTLRHAAFAKAMQLSAVDGYYYEDGRGFLEDNFHRILSSPSVFNFYSPDHVPNGPLSEQGLYAPEFEINNSVSSIGYLNSVNKWTSRGDVFTASELTEHVEVDKNHYLEMAKDPEVLINHLDMILTKGRMSESTRSIIEEAVQGLSAWNEERMLHDRWEIATYLVMISPEFTILK
jgi:uncharacterized protein (DUF1800 family)